jgi:L-2-hydroxyglutarate oxidase LhgO
MKESTSIDLAIIGAGVVGLSIAKVIQSTFPNWQIALFDKMPYLAEHSSGRNSGVLHAGLYYENESLKKRLCLRGNELWKEWSRELGLTVNNCGKYITGRGPDSSRLKTLFDRALTNGATVRWASSQELEEMSRYVKADRAFFSENTSIVDPSDLMNKLLRLVESKDIPVLFNHELIDLKKKGSIFELEFLEYTVKSKIVINCSGLGAVDIRKMLGLSDLTNRYVKGSYVKLRTSFYSKSLLYTLPLNGLLGLGVHSCIDSDETVKFGPNAVEGISEIDYAISEEACEGLKDEVLKFFKTSKSDLTADFSGIRAKVQYGGTDYQDFWIQSPIENYIECCGIDSPGLTSAPAIGEYVVKKYLAINN